MLSALSRRRERARPHPRMTIAPVTLSLAVAIAAGVTAQGVARLLRLPGIVILLALGTILGPELLGWVDPSSLGSGLFVLTDFAVAVILFEGGLNLEGTRLRRQERAIRRLITLGAIVTLFGGTVAAKLLLDWPWERAALFGSLVVVTGPTVVAPLLRDMRLRPRPKAILEAEGVLIDPIGAILAVLVLEIVLVPAGETLASGIRDLVFRIGIGAGAGIAGGLLLGWILGLPRVVPHGFQNIIALGSVILLYGVSDHLLSHSGIVAVTAAGVVVGNMKTPVDRDLREFKDQLTILLVGLLFVLLAADIRLADVRSLGWPGALVVAALVLVVRPLAVWASTVRTRLPMNERLFIAWVAPRGIVAAAIASLTAASLDAGGIVGGAQLRALVFLTIAGTVVLAGLTARPVASLLGLRLPSRDRVAILGAQGLGLLLARELKRAGSTVTFLESDPKNCRRAEEAGFPVVLGDALEERTMLRAHPDLVGTAIGLTPNEHLNSLFAGQAKTLFGVPRTFVAVDALPKSEAPSHARRHATDVLFDGPHDAARWDVRARHGEVDVERLVWNPPPKEPAAKSGESRPAAPVAGTAAAAAAAPPAQPVAQPVAQPETPPKAKNGGSGKRVGPPGDPFVILAVVRDKRTAPMTLSFELKKGDVASVAIFRPERDRALERLAAAGWSPPETETASELPARPPAETPARAS